MEEDIKKRLASFMKETGTSQNQVAKALGKSGSALSQWQSGTYKGDNASMEERVRDYLRAVEEDDGTAAALEEQGIVETSCYKAVSKFCSLVFKNRMMGMLIGDAGAGKTTALRDYLRKHPASILVEADPGYTPRIFFEDLCSRLNVSAPNTTHDKFMQVVSKLKGSGRLLMVDEAEWLPMETLEYVRRIHDKAGIGIVLCGLPRLEHNVRGKREQFLQLSSRIQLVTRLKTLTEKDVEAYLESRFEKYEGECAATLVEYSGRNCRIMANLCKLSVEAMAFGNIPSLSREVLDKARSMSR
jgi:DNA transposition AAA+ family ATPase